LPKDTTTTKTIYGHFTIDIFLICLYICYRGIFFDTLEGV
jgi:hypothetical protein